MNRIAWQYCFVVLFCMQAFSLFANEQARYESRIDSLRKEIESKSGEHVVEAQLELALLKVGTDKSEAQLLADAALQAARESGKKTLLMKAFYAQGRVLLEKERYEASQAFMDTALVLGTELNDNWYKGEILYRMGTNYHFLSDEIGALKSFNDAVQACRLSDNYKTLGSAYSMMGTIFRMNGLYDRAIEYIIKSELNYEKAGFTEGSAWADYLLGRTYADLGLQNEALEYFGKSLESYKKLAKIDGDEGGLAICYAQIALLNIAAEEYDEARNNIENTRKIYSEKGSKFGMSNVYKDLGILEYSLGNYQLAESNLRTALVMKEGLNEVLSSPVIFEYLGLSMIGQGQVTEGIEIIKKGLELAITNDQKKIQLDIYGKLTQAYLDMGDLKSAIDCQNKQIRIQDLILAGGGNIKASQLSAMYEIDQKNNQIAELEKQNKINELSIREQRIIRNFMISAVVLALLIAGVILWFYRKLKYTNRELFEANAAKDRFFAIISHDLRGPTGSLTSFLLHLNANFDQFSKEELKEMVAILCQSSENVSQLLENLLIWAQSQSEKIEYRPERLSLTDCIDSVVKGLSQMAEHKEIDIRFEREQDLVVFADRNMLQTILRNVLSNAIKFTRRGGHVLIHPEMSRNNTVLVRISDTGVGIEKSKLASIFDISNSYHTHGTENEMSTGLGLILVKDFIEKNRGSISIESEQEKGTTVSFTLPATAPGARM
ncbi:MAG: tetratricopeptide repeat protein [Draconibacterium sp.]